MADAVTLIGPRSLSVATLMARKGVDAAAIGAALGLVAPVRPERTVSATLSLIATGPGVWLALADEPGERWPEALEARLGELASVSDQSGAYLVWRLLGPDAGRILQKGVVIDLDVSVFGPGAAAVTVIAHVGVILWRLPNLEGFEVAAFRSYARDVQHWLETEARAMATP